MQCNYIKQTSFFEKTCDINSVNYSDSHAYFVYINSEYFDEQN